MRGLERLNHGFCSEKILSCIPSAFSCRHKDFSFHRESLSGTRGLHPPWGLQSTLRHRVLGRSHGLSPTAATQPSLGAWSIVIPAEQAARHFHWTAKDKVTSVASGMGDTQGYVSGQWVVCGVCFFSCLQSPFRSSALAPDPSKFSFSLGSPQFLDLIG